MPSDSPWKPIRSAPREKRVLLYVPRPQSKDGDCFIGRYEDGLGWTKDASRMDAVYPSHWMPLPPRQSESN
jgi:hypothetical protein